MPGAWYETTPSARRPPQRPAFCPACSDGQHRHRGPCWRYVAPEPGDYVCACGHTQPRILYTDPDWSD